MARIPPAGRVHRPDDRDKGFPLRAALHPRAAVVAPLRKRWTLRRDWQLDQGDTPQCVAFSGAHWERAQPICSKTGDSGLTPDQLYHECKLIDGYPDEDGTDARSLLKVYQRFGKVESYHWYTGDLEALRLWVLTKSPALLGAYWTEEMFSPPPDDVLLVGNDFQYGHEVLLIGYDRPRGLWEICNSWKDWGDRQRAYITDRDLQRLLDADGDAVGAVEARRPHTSTGA